MRKHIKISAKGLVSALALLIVFAGGMDLSAAGRGEDLKTASRIEGSPKLTFGRRLLENKRKSSYESLDVQNFAYKKNRDWKVWRGVRTGGYVAMGAGLVSIAAGTVLYIGFPPPHGRNNAALACTVVGGGLFAAGIPIVIMSNNKMKGIEEASLNLGVSVIQNEGRAVPALAFALQF